MELGQIVDFVIEYNDMHDLEKHGEQSSRGGKGVRAATQEDWDAFWG